MMHVRYFMNLINCYIWGLMLFLLDIVWSDTLLWRGLTGVHAAPKTARSRLNTYFNMNMNNQVDHSGTSRPVTVCLVDEMDYLISQNFDVMYHFYSWPQQKDSNFILLGIANTMDLPERLSTR